jgi:hypothetical protein
MRLDADQVTAREAFDVTPYFDDLTGNFVAKDRPGDGGKTSLEYACVRSAKPDRDGPDGDITRPDALLDRLFDT